MKKVFDKKVTIKPRKIIEKDSLYQPPEKEGPDLTTSQLCRMFEVTPMTIHTWRKSKNLPFFHLTGGKKPPVRYNEKQIKHWADAYGIEIVRNDYKRY